MPTLCPAVGRGGVAALNTGMDRSPAQQAILDLAERDGVRGFFRFGDLPEFNTHHAMRCSRNHRDDGVEEGVSVYPGWQVGTRLVLDLRGIDAFSALPFVGSDLPIYLCSGVLSSALGSDGEPLMLDDSADIDPDDEWTWMLPEPTWRMSLTRITPDGIDVVLI